MLLLKVKSRFNLIRQNGFIYGISKQFSHRKPFDNEDKISKKITPTKSTTRPAKAMHVKPFFDIDDLLSDEDEEDKNEIVGNFLKFNLRTQRNVEEYREYFTFSSKLTERQYPSSIPLFLLYYLPEASVRLKIEQTFVENILLNWFLSLKIRLNSVSDQRLVDILSILNQINIIVKGDLIRKLSWENLLTLIDVSLNNVRLQNLKYFNELIEILNSFLAGNKDETVEKYLIEQLSSVFESFLINFDSSKMTDEKSFGQLLCGLAEIGVPQPSVECLSKIIEICSRLSNFGARDQNENYSCLLTLENVGQAFLIWNIDPDEYFQDFWWIYFNKVFELLENMSSNVIGKNILLGLQFNKLSELNDLKQLWLTKFSHKGLSLELFNEINDLVQTKLQDEPDSSRYGRNLFTLLKEIVVVLNQFTVYSKSKK